MHGLQENLSGRVKVNHEEGITVSTHSAYSALEEQSNPHQEPEAEESQDAGVRSDADTGSKSTNSAHGHSLTKSSSSAKSHVWAGF